MTDDSPTAAPASTGKKRRRSGRPRTGGGSGKARRKAARLAAVQALYQLDLNDTAINAKSVEAVVIEFVEHRLGVSEEEETLVAADPQLFADVLRGACHRRSEVDALLTAALDDKHPLDRLELPLRAILRAGAFEIFSNLPTHPRILINDYVDVAHAFYAGKEPGMVNGVLDRVAKTVRWSEMDVPPPVDADGESDGDGDGGA